MSSHREAPEISKDPVADSTDVYAFMSPDEGAAGTVTLIANYIPLQAPDGGPNFYEFGDDVLYEIHIDNTGDGVPDISYQFRFTTVNNIPSSFLYNDGPITSSDTPVAVVQLEPPADLHADARRPQSGQSWGGSTVVLGTGLLCPPCNIGPLSTPNYAGLATAAIHAVGAGPFSARCSPGSGPRASTSTSAPCSTSATCARFAGDHAGGAAAGLMNGMPGVNSTADVNVHTLALQIPTAQLTRSTPTGPSDPAAVIGVWTTASRQRVRVWGNWLNGGDLWSGPWTQVSRLGNPLVNELLIGIGAKDLWNTQPPTADGTEFLHYFAEPLLAQLLPTCTRGSSPISPSTTAAHPTPGRTSRRSSSRGSRQG